MGTPCGTIRFFLGEASASDRVLGPCVLRAVHERNPVNGAQSVKKRCSLKEQRRDNASHGAIRFLRGNSLWNYEVLPQGVQEPQQCVEALCVESLVAKGIAIQSSGIQGWHRQGRFPMSINIVPMELVRSLHGYSLCGSCVSAESRKNAFHGARRFLHGNSLRNYQVLPRGGKCLRQSAGALCVAGCLEC